MQIRAWVERITPLVHRQLMQERRTRVALDDGAICGFATTTVPEGQVNALYVAPFAMHQGVGQALLADAEEAIVTAGRLDANLHATRNAVDFYAWLGYEVVGEVQQRLAGGVAITGTHMRRRLV